MLEITMLLTFNDNAGAAAKSSTSNFPDAKIMQVIADPDPVIAGKAMEAMMTRSASTARR